MRLKPSLLLFSSGHHKLHAHEAGIVLDYAKDPSSLAEKINELAEGFVSSFLNQIFLFANHLHAYW